MKIVFCWWTFEGHFAACWRTLARLRNVEVAIIAQRPDPESLAPYDPKVLAGLECSLCEPAQLTDPEFILERITALKPDVVAVPGWVNPAPYWALKQPALEDVGVVMASDTPYRGTLRQLVGGSWKRGDFERVDQVVVAGERAWQLAQRLGFAEDQVRRGMYGVDAKALKNLWTERTRLHAQWPKRFMYVGRYVDIKGIDELAEGYRRYRKEVGAKNAWELVCCGKGPLEKTLAAAGTTLRGFVQPPDMPTQWADAGAFVIMSRYEPWCQALVEAACAGLPLICTDSVGAAPEMLRPFYNGLLVPTGDSYALCQAMVWLHDHRERLVEMGRRSRELGTAYGSDMWAERWLAAAVAAQRRRRGILKAKAKRRRGLGLWG